VLKRINAVMDRMMAQVLAALSWIAYAWVVMIAWNQGRNWLAANDSEGNTGLKLALLGAALILAFPRITDRIGLPRSWLLGSLRTVTVVALLIFGGTTISDHSAEETQPDIVEMADEKMRLEEKLRLQAIATSESKEASREDSNARGLTYIDCVERGIQWFKEIGSYPTLSNGENATSVAKNRCLNTNSAFGPW